MENLIVVSKVKKFIKEKADMNTSAGFFEPVNNDIIRPFNFLFEDVSEDFIGCLVVER